MPHGTSLTGGGGEREGRDEPDQGGRVLGTELVGAQGQGKAEMIQAKVGREKQ